MQILFYFIFGCLYKGQRHDKNLYREALSFSTLGNAKIDFLY